MRVGVEVAVAHLLNRNRPDEVMILLGRAQHQKIVENGGNVGPGRRDLPAGQFARLPCRHCGDAERVQPCGDDGEEIYTSGAVERGPLESTQSVDEEPLHLVGGHLTEEMLPPPVEQMFLLRSSYNVIPDER